MANFDLGLLHRGLLGVSAHEEADRDDDAALFRDEGVDVGDVVALGARLQVLAGDLGRPACNRLLHALPRGGVERPVVDAAGVGHHAGKELSGMCGLGRGCDAPALPSSRPTKPRQRQAGLRRPGQGPTTGLVASFFCASQMDSNSYRYVTAREPRRARPDVPRPHVTGPRQYDAVSKHLPDGAVPPGRAPAVASELRRTRALPGTDIGSATLARPGRRGDRPAHGLILSMIRRLVCLRP